MGDNHPILNLKSTNDDDHYYYYDDDDLETRDTRPTRVRVSHTCALRFGVWKIVDYDMITRDFFAFDFMIDERMRYTVC